MSKKILFILSSVSKTGGIEKYNSNLVNHSVDAGYMIKIVSRNDIDKEYGNVPVYSSGRIKNTLLRKVSFLFTSFWFSCSFKPDLIICGHINFSPVCYLVSILLRKKYLVLTHGIDVWDITNRMKIKGLKRADAVLTVSDFTKKRILEQVPQVANRIRLLPNTVNGSIFTPGPKPEHLMKKYGITKNNKVLLTVARLNKTEKNKGYYKVLDIMPHLLEQVPEIIYVIAGSGDDLGNIKKYVRGKNIANSVILAGYVPEHELQYYYNLSDLFVMPSKKEGFGIVFLEALACGKPVVCGNRDGSVDAVLNGEVGVMVDPDSTEEIGKAILKVLSSEDYKKRSNMESLREKIIGEFGFDRFKERAEKCFDEICLPN